MVFDFSKVKSEVKEPEIDWTKISASAAQGSIAKGVNAILKAKVPTIQDIPARLPMTRDVQKAFKTTYDFLRPEEERAKKMGLIKISGEGDTATYLDPLGAVGVGGAIRGEVSKVGKGIVAKIKDAIFRPPPSGENLLARNVDRPALSTLLEKTPQVAIQQKGTIASSLNKTYSSLQEESRGIVPTIQRAKTSILEFLQNSQERVRAITSNSSLKIDDVSDPYLRMKLFPGRLRDKLDSANVVSKEIVEGYVGLEKTLKLPQGEAKKLLNQYLIAKHAPERNAVLGDRAAGISTKEANDFLRAFDAFPASNQIKQIADKARSLDQESLTLLREAQVISKETFDTLVEKYPNHVPLYRILEETDDIGSLISGKGFDVRSTGLKKAVGSELEVADVIENIVENYERAAIRAEKNIVDLATLRWVRDNEQILKGFIDIEKPKAIGKTFEGSVLLERTNDPTVLQMFEEGKPVWIRFKDKALALAFRDANKQEFPSAFSFVAKFTRLYSGLATRFNPDFAMSNKVRDLQEVMTYLSSDSQVGGKGAVSLLTREPASIKAVTDWVRGKDSEGARLYQRMKELGGTTGGMALSTRRQIELDIRKLESLARSAPKRYLEGVKELVDSWNTIFEDSTRLSVFKTSLEHGLSEDRAAFLAKHASIDFDTKGTAGPIINSVWMFANASLQGSVKMIRALANPKTAVIVATTLTSSNAVVVKWNDAVDPDWRNKVTEWDRMNSLVVMLPAKEGARMMAIPVSWGLKPIHVAANYAVDAAYGRGIDVKAAIEDSLGAFINAYNPAGGSDVLSSLTPTILQVPSELNRNRQWSGSPIKPDTYGQNIPEDVRYFQSLKTTTEGRIAVAGTELLQNFIGVAVSPADVKYAYDQYISGAGRFVSKTINSLVGLIKGEPLPLDQYPFISRFYRERTEEEVGRNAGRATDGGKLLDVSLDVNRERFYQKQQITETINSLTLLTKDEAKLKLKDIASSQPELAEGVMERLEDMSIGLTGFESELKHESVETRARFIASKIDDFKSAEEYKTYLKDLSSKGILTDSVMNILEAIFAELESK